MSISFPRPHKPNTRADSVGPANVGQAKWFDRDGKQTNAYLYGAYPDTGYGIRSYGTGYPLRSNGNRLVKHAASYAIFGKVQRYQYGTCIAQYIDNGRISRTFTGPSENSLPSIGRDESPFFNGVGFVGMPFNVRNRIGTEVMLKVGGKKASFGEALAESRETVKMLTSAATDLFRAYKAAKHGNWRGVAKALKVRPKDFRRGKTTSEKWLAYQYGWKPLMSDIHDAYDLLQKGFREKAQIAASVRNLKDSNEYSLTYPAHGVTGYVRCSSQVQYTAKVFYRIDDSTLSKFNQIGMINPLSVAWEVVPFSFVVDWFLPVGNFLEALTAPLGVSFVDGYFGTRVEGSLHACSPNRPPSDQILVQEDREEICEQFGYTREVMSGFPVPSLYIKSPFSTGHALNALALLSQLTKR
jgi:soluble cytochrome b562